MIDSKEKLNVYIQERIKNFRGFHIDILNRLNDDKLRLLDKVDSKEIDINDPELNESFRKLDRIIGLNFNYCVIIASVSFLEESLKIISQIDKANLTHYNSYMKNKGNFLEKHVKFYTDIHNISFSENSEIINNLNKFIRIRNFITHAWGNFQIEQKYSIDDLVNEMKGLQKFKDGFLHIDEELPKDAVINSEKVIKHILNSINIL